MIGCFAFTPPLFNLSFRILGRLGLKVLPYTPRRPQTGLTHAGLTQCTRSPLHLCAVLTAACALCEVQVLPYPTQQFINEMYEGYPWLPHYVLSYVAPTFANLPAASQISRALQGGCPGVAFL